MATGNGSIERPLPEREWYIPKKIWLEPDKLIWEPDPDVREVRPGPGMLTDFVNLAVGPDERILKFAQRWGVLMLCEHGLPTSHNPHKRSSAGFEFGCYPRGWFDRPPGVVWAPLADWRFWARQARALLNIAANLHCDKVGEPSDWQTVYERTNTSHSAVPWWQQDIEVDRMKVADVVNEWLDLAQSRLFLRWRPAQSPSVEVSGASLFGSLGVQILFAISRSDGLALCSACGIPYPPSKRPKPGQRNYCRDCGKKAAQRDAARDYRKRRANRGKTS